VFWLLTHHITSALVTPLTPQTGSADSLKLSSVPPTTPGGEDLTIFASFIFLPR